MSEIQKEIDAKVAALPAMIRSVFGRDGGVQWPIIDTQALSFDLVNELRNKTHGDLFLIGVEVADHIRYTNSEAYFTENDGKEGALYPFFDVSFSASGRESGFVGTLFGMDVFTHPDIVPNVFACVKQGNKPMAVIGYVKL